MVSAQECETSVIRSIHSSSELTKCLLRGSITSSNQVCIVDRRGVIFLSLDHDLASVGQHDLQIKELNKIVTYMTSKRYLDPH